MLDRRTEGQACERRKSLLGIPAQQKRTGKIASVDVFSSAANQSLEITQISKFAAFTLAEVLITLGIIGIVSAMTIPVLINKFQNQEIVANYKKDYSVLSSAVTQIKIDNGGTMAGGFGTTDSQFVTTLTKYVKFLKVCPNNAYTEGCSTYTGLNGANIKMLDGNNWPWPSMFTYPGLILPNGSLIILLGTHPNCDSNYSGLNVNACTEIYLDANGTKGPNIHGRDILRVYITENGLIPAGSHGDEAVTDPTRNGCYDIAGTTGNGEGCAARILREGAINY